MFTGTLITASPASAWYQNQCAHADGNLRLWESTYYSGACGEEPAGTNYSDTRGQAYNDGASVYLHTQSAENDDTYWLGVVLYDYTGYSGPSKQINTYQSSAGIGFVGVGSLQWWRN
ncbi:MAG: hypothetical protein HOV83_24670 [Catenulispora sp.]|nr:hypothetical protein [Catenulispora sp.]